MGRDYAPVFVTEDGTILLPNRQIESVFAMPRKGGTYSIVVNYGVRSSNLITGLDRNQANEVLAGIIIALKNEEPVINFSIVIEETLKKLEGEKNENIL